MRKSKIVLFLLMCSLLAGCDTTIVVVPPSLNTASSTVISTSNKNSSSVCSSLYHYGDKVAAPALVETNYYTEKDDVALYLTTFHKLPENFIKKSVYDTEGNKYGSSTRIGGDVFSNRFGDNQYSISRFNSMTECDIASSTSKRGTRRLVYNIEYRVFYTDDHYESFQEYLGYKNWGPTFDKGKFIEICRN